MPIYKPPKADTDLLRSLEDIERQLDEIRGRIVAPAEAAEPEEKPSDPVLEFFQETTLPPADSKTTGMPLRVLHEDGQFREALDGIVKAVPAGLGLGRTDGSGSVTNAPTRIVSVQGSLTATGAISADTLRARDWTGPRQPVVQIASQFKAAANSGATETSLVGSGYVCTIPPLGVDGDGVDIVMSGALAANTNAKTLKVYIAGTLVMTVFSSTTNVASNRFEARVGLFKQGTDVRRLNLATYDSASTSPTVTHLGGTAAGASLDWTVPQTCYLTVQGTSSDDITMANWYVLLRKTNP